jgi:hypothetical protein
VSARAVARLLAAYAIALVVACVVVRSVVGLRIDPNRAETIASAWSKGQLVARAVVASPGDHEASLDAAIASTPDAQIVYERVVADGPILTTPEIVFALSLVAGKDGAKATLNGATAYVTPDDLLSRQGYDKGKSIPDLSLSVGTDVPLVLALLADRLHASVPDVMAKATIHRIRVERVVPNATPVSVVTAQSLNADDVRTAAIDAGAYLARGVRIDGRYRYFVDAPSNRNLSGYDWPRHAGATYFLAQASALSNDATMRAATLRAASLLRDGAIARCGEHACIGTDDVVEIGSAALATIAFAEVVRTGIDPSYRPLVVELARFLREQQRPDGEFMHQYDRRAKRAIDVQFLYFSGEATLALARAAAITGDAADLAAASKGLAHLVGPAWHFFGSRYYFGEEHWTCQALDDLWNKAPDRDALDFCVRWHQQNRLMQFREGDTPFDAEGSFGVTPIITPRLTPVGSRCEAAVATLSAARKAGLPQVELDLLDAQLRRSLALLIRQQLRGAASHLFADPAAVHGAMPGSSVDWQLRIDYAQHAGSAMVRWLEVSK